MAFLSNGRYSGESFFSILFLCVIGCIAPSAEASDSSTALTRPRIALVLSGGGARGAAHIGVLNTLKSLQIPIDCIVGTSMGAIVGGLYASGMETTELEKVITETDWHSIFNDRPHRSEISIRRKMDDLKGLADPEFGVQKNGLSVPKGLISGIAIENYLYHLTRRTTSIDHFDLLPIPFRAIAADIETGEEVILKQGNLAQALRASMSIPGVMAPVEINNRLLVDGGIANNLPIEPARQFCGDVIIAVNIQTPPLRRDQLTSAVSISAQMINLLGKANVDRQLSSLRSGVDILITPELQDFSSTDFDRQKEAIIHGETATRAVTEQLQRYSLDKQTFASFRAQQTSPLQNIPQQPIEHIQFEGLNRTNKAVLTDLMKIQPGALPDDNAIAADVRRLYGRGDFESIDYRILTTPPHTLLVSLREKSWGPDYLRFGIGLAADSSGESSFSLAANYRRSWLNPKGGEWVTDLRIGNNSTLGTEFYQPIDAANHFFTSAYGQLQNSQQYIFNNDNRIASYRSIEYRLGADIGANLGTVGMLRLGPLWRMIKLDRETGPTELPGSYTQRLYSLRSQLYIDQTDQPWFPRSGYKLSISAVRSLPQSSSDSNYTRLESKGQVALSLAEHTLNLTLSGGKNIGKNIPITETFTLGGPLSLSSYRLDELRGEHYLFTKLEYYNRTIRLPSLFGSGVYLGVSSEIGRVGKLLGSDRKNSGLRASASLFLAADTAFGPAYLGLATGDNNKMRLYFMLGIPP